MAKRSQSTRADIAAALTGLELPNQQQNHQLLHALQHNDAPLTQSAQRLAQIMYRSGLIPQSVDVSKLVDDRFAHKGALMKPTVRHFAQAVASDYHFALWPVVICPAGRNAITQLRARSLIPLSIKLRTMNCCAHNVLLKSRFAAMTTSV